MKAFTDYPIEELGDQPGKRAPVREVAVLSYDGDKYCEVKVEGVTAWVKTGYIYQRPGRFGAVPGVTVNQLREITE